MNTFDVQDDVASAPWPDFPWAMGDYSHTSVPQNTHLDLIPTPGYLSTAGPYVPDFNATDYATFTLSPATEMGMFTNLPTTQVDYAYRVSNQINQHASSTCTTSTVHKYFMDRLLHSHTPDFCIEQ